jgi:NAD(P)H-nitrite reductase large subunit
VKDTRGDYDRLLLCTGAAPRRLTCPGAELTGIHYLRGIGDVADIRLGMREGARIVIVGGIGRVPRALSGRSLALSNRFAKTFSGDVDAHSAAVAKDVAHCLAD